MPADFALLLAATLLSLAILVWALVCVFHSLSLWVWIKRSRGPSRLSYFNGPWATRAGLSLITCWWAVTELVRIALPYFNADEARLACKLCILSAMGFAEPALLLLIALLLTASLSRSHGALTPHWNSRILSRAMAFSLPLFVIQFGVIFLRDTIASLGQWWLDALMTPQRGAVRCSYPLINTAIMGIYEVGLVEAIHAEPLDNLAVHVFFCGVAMVSLTMNKALKRRVRVAVFLVVGCLPMRAVLLGVTVLLPHTGEMAHYVLFFALLMFLCCAAGGLWVLVYCPVVDSLGATRLPYHLYS